MSVRTTTSTRHIKTATVALLEERQDNKEIKRTGKEVELLAI